MTSWGAVWYPAPVSTPEPTPPTAFGSAPEAPEAPPAGSSPSAPGSRAWKELKGALSGIHGPGAAACLVASAAIITSHHQGDTSFFRAHLAGRFGASPLAELYPFLYWFAASVALYLAVPLAAAAATPGLRVRDTGLGAGDWKVGLAAAGAAFLLFAPVVFAASRFPDFAQHYPLCAAARRSVGAFLLYEAFYAAYFVSWEYLFRGYLLFSLEPSMGKAAVFAQMMPFAVLHFGKPQAEVYGSVAAGVLLGLLALRTRSFWYGALLHIAVAWSMDLFAAFGALRALP